MLKKNLKEGTWYTSSEWISKSALKLFLKDSIFSYGDNHLVGEAYIKKYKKLLGNGRGYWGICNLNHLRVIPKNELVDYLPEDHPDIPKEKSPQDLKVLIKKILQT